MSDLLDLQLHQYEDEVKHIVDKAVKEMGMEKTLKDLEIVWGSMEFDQETHERTNMQILKTSEELIETLEENQVTKKIGIY